MNKKFSRPPLSAHEKEKKAEDFLNFQDSSEKKIYNQLEPSARDLKKEGTLAFTIRLPKALIEDLDKITTMTGLSRNAIASELLRIGAKAKLKEIRNES